MAQPTALEQETLELINRMRMNPADELALLTQSNDGDVNSAIDYFNVDLEILAQQWSSLTPVQPLAWSDSLNEAAEGHNELMIQFDSQSHQLPGEASLGQRLTNAGYTWSAAGENIFLYADSVFYAHAAFAIDWGFTSTGIQNPPGHRNNLMNNNFREIGVDIILENDPSTDAGPLVITHNLGNRSAINNQAWLLGVAYRDFDDDGFYDAGEGLNDVTINVSGINGTVFNGSTNTMDAGGYQILLNPGNYQVDFLRDNGILDTEIVTIGTSNIKVDLELEVLPHPDAGKGKIIGTQFNDANGNGIWDTNESGLANWTMFLDTNNNGKLDGGEQSTVTDANGEYYFNNLNPGSYRVAEVLPSGWQQTLPNPSQPVGFETYKLDDGTGEGGIGYTSGDTMIFNRFTVAPGQETITSITVGLYNINPKAVFLYQDLDNDTKPDANEQILQVTTNLTGNSGLVNIPITPTTVSGTFFVAALYQGNGSNTTFVPRDTTSPQNQSWLATGAAGAFDLNNFNAFSVSGVDWLLRANSTATLPQIVTVDADEIVTNVNFGNKFTNNIIQGTNNADHLIGTLSNELFNGLDGNDTIDGLKGNDTINGDEGNDILNGNGGRDRINGFAGNDILNGSTGKDNLNGSYGNDTLIGGTENDILTGGKGFDTFVYNNPNEGLDSIKGFSTTQDVIQVSASGFQGGLTPGNTLSASQFIIGSAATTSSHRFIYDSGSLWFDVDGVGSASAVNIAKLSNSPLDFSASDIFVIT